MEPTQSRPPIDRLGDFEIHHELGRGGMGIVYHARQISLNRPVALKVLSGGLGLTSQAILRFRREAAAAAKLHHTNIVPIYATGENDGMHYYAMELIEGLSLDRVIRQMQVSQSAQALVKKSEVAASNTPSGERSADLAATVAVGSKPETRNPKSEAPKTSTTTLGSGHEHFDTAARLIAEIADALDYAHKHGVIHRDIKPSNMLLSPEGRLSVNDFGLARILEEPGMTITGEFMGSPHYMSPEQITAGRAPLNHRTDIYSLGATLYELLTLEKPFTGDSRDQVIAQVMHKEPKPPRRVNKKVPVDLETICLKAMEKDPDRRYQTGGEMAEDLRRYAKRFEISARRANPVQRVVKWTRRHPALATALGVAVVAALAALGFAFQAKSSQEKMLSQQRRSALEKASLVALSGDLNAAEKAISEAELLQASPAQIRFLRGQVAYFRGETTLAVQHLEQAVKLQPESLSARAVLAASYVYEGQWEKHLEMMAVLERMRPATPEDRLFLAVAMTFLSPARALPMLDEAIQQRDSPLARLTRAGTRADYAMDTSDLASAELAIQDVTLANSMMPVNAAVLNQSVFVHLAAAAVCDKSDPKKRESYLAQAGRDAKALEQFPVSPSAAMARLFYLRHLGKPAFYEQARRLHEQVGNSQTAYYYSLNLYERGEFKQAAEVLEQRGTKRTQGEDNIRGYILTELPEGRASALVAYQDFEARRKGDGVIYGKTILLLLGMKAEAVAAARETAKDKSLLPQLNREFFEKLLSFLGEQVSAAELVTAAGKSRRNQVMAHFIIGCMRLAEGNRNEARDHFQKAVATDCFYFLDYDWSRAFLGRMEKDPTWPPWIPVKK